MIKKKFLTLFILICIINHLNSQNIQTLKKCNTTYLVNKAIVEDYNYKIGIEESNNKNNNWIKNNKSNITKETLIIPTVVHVIYRNSHSNIGSGTNISDAKIEDAIRILNEDYSKTNPEFPNPPRNTFVNYAGNPNLQFCLATEDENGNPTNGITRTSTNKQNYDPDSESNDMKRNNTGGKDGWDPSRYLNIWVCDLAVTGSGGMVLGYAYLPGLPSWMAWRDGLVVDYQFFGTIQGSIGDGRTATHEIGHYLGLQHTFCESSSGGCCDNDDNNVSDTPATSGVYWGGVNSNTNNNSCNDLLYGFSSDLLDMDENYMSYAQNTWMFSNSQCSAMNATLNGYRSSLKNSNVTVNCSGTGTGTNNILEQTKVYPNPNNGIFEIETQPNSYILIRNTIGKLVNKPFYSDKNKIIISLENIMSGIYYIEIIRDNQKEIQKIIISK